MTPSGVVFRSEKWSLVPSEVRKGLGLKRELDGEFWMNYQDFCRFFSRVYICTLGPDFDRDGKVDKGEKPHDHTHIDAHTHMHAHTH